MRRSKRLKVVLDLAERKEQSALDDMTAVKSQLDQHQAQLNSLQDYQRQYMDNMKQAMHGTLAVRELQSYQGFISQVENAVTHQLQVVAQWEQRFEQSKVVWLACREKKKGLADLIEKYRLQEQIADEKKAAKILEDDLTSRRSRR